MNQSFSHLPVFDGVPLTFAAPGILFSVLSSKQNLELLRFSNENI